MRKATTAICLLVSMIFCVACNSADTEGDRTEKVKNDVGTTKNVWENLLDEKELPWHTYGKATTGSAWKLEGNVLHLDASDKDEWQTKNGGDIVTNDEYENFHLKLEWKISEAGNSGIIFYVNEDTSKYKYAWESGPEMQIADNEKNEDGKIAKSRAGEL